MKPAFFIVPGFGHQATEEPYAWLRKHVKTLGYEPKLVPITWKYKTMTDHVAEFLNFFERHKSEQNFILGFSFGAMIAFISSPDTRPEHLYLCSLSPYFQEDISDMKNWWKRFMGKRRMASFKQYKSTEIAKRITAPTTIFCGEAEAIKFPSLKKRCEHVHNRIRSSQITFPENAPHQIEFPTYKQAIKDAIT